jgi:2-aminoadipate transaminase
MLREISLDANSDVPIYRQLYETIASLIRSAHMVPGDRLPPTRELAGELGLNRTTVSAAYALLESEGLIKGHVGRGSYVTGEPAPSAADGIDWEQLLEPGWPAGVPASALAPSDGTISFATSRPSEQLFPLDEFRATVQEVIAGEAASTILQLGSPGGYAPLREHLLAEARRAGLARAHDEVVITNGCQQALDLIQRVLVRAGDVVVVEDPVYPGLRNTFLRAGARLAGVPVGLEGVDSELLERTLLRERPRLVVLTPNFQNPTGTTMPPAARRAVLRAAREVGTVVVENDIYGELRYQGDTLATLKELDDRGDVVQMRSFSKVAFPGLRVGWITGPRVLLARIEEAKQWTDLHTDQLSQAVLLRFAESGRLARHRDRIVAAGAERLRAVLSACEGSLPGGARFTRPQGGMNLWVRLPEPLDSGEVLARAQRESVTYLPGRYFEVARRDPGALRLSFAGLAPDKIRSGIAVLGRIFTKELERARDAHHVQPAPAMV